MPRITLKRGLGIAAALLVCGAAVIAVRSMLYVRRELRPARRPVTEADRERATRALGELRDVDVTASDGSRVKGWYAAPKNGATVVLLHGVGGNRTQLLPEAERLSARGFGILTIDFRAHGESDGALCTWGDKERLDFEAALDFLSRQGGSRVGVLGVSMGASVAATVGARDKRPLAFALLGASDSLRDSTEYDLRKWGPVGFYPALWQYRRDGVRYEEVDVVGTIGALSPRPVLVVTGSADPYVPQAMTDKIYAAAREPRSLYVVERAGHGEYAEAGGEPYFAKIVELFERWLSPPN